MDYFHSFGGLGLGSRLKRLSDMLMTEVKQVYISAGVDFEPRWFPLFHILYKQGEITVTEAASQLNLTHPHISQLVKELQTAKLIALRAHRSDKRSRIITMSAKGRQLVQTLEPLWDSISQAVSDMIDETEPGFLIHLDKMERAVRAKPLSQSVQQLVKARAQKNCKILDYAPALKPHFERLNREWLEKYFVVEEIDVKYFKNPEKLILSQGGDIFFAELDGRIVGTCSLVKDGDKWELAKMGVAEPMRGKGIGELLVKEAIRRARQKKVKKLMLITNSSLTPAVRLYQKLGFKETFRGSLPKYKRGDLMMEAAI